MVVFYLYIQMSFIISFSNIFQYLSTELNFSSASELNFFFPFFITLYFKTCLNKIICKM